MMGLTFDNQTLLYIIIAIFIIQMIIMRFYVQSSIEDSQQKNNKKLIKKLTGQISTTFDQYMGVQKNSNAPNTHNPKYDSHGTGRGEYVRRHDIDSVDDPADDIDDVRDTRDTRDIRDVRDNETDD